MKTTRLLICTLLTLIMTFFSVSSEGQPFGVAAAARLQPAISPEDARRIGVDAYIYLYPLVTMDITRKQSTNIEPGKENGKGPMNVLANLPEYPRAETKIVVRPNFDTLYSSAWLDLTKEPLVVSAPDTDGRYYLLPMLDMWSDVFASPGWRTTGTSAVNFLLTPPGWTGTVSDEFMQIKAPTPYVWLIGRTKTDDRPITNQCIKSRRVIKSHLCLAGANRRSRLRSSQIRPWT